MREIGFDHQHCTFHLLLNINEELREELKQIRKEYESNLKKQNPKLSETGLDLFRLNGKAPEPSGKGTATEKSRQTAIAFDSGRESFY